MSNITNLMSISLMISMLLWLLFCRPGIGFNFENDFEVGNFIHRISKREKEEKEFAGNNHFNGIPLEPECDEHSIDVRDTDHLPKSRKKRATIAFPQRSKFTAELYYAIPLIAPKQITIPIAFGIPFSFDIPNATSPYKFKGRSAQDRFNIYGAIEGLIHSFGIDGRSCVLRAICERAEHHLLTNGIWSELANLILSVTTTSNDGLMYDYIEAEKVGRDEGNCKAKYYGCPFSIFKILGSF